MFLAVSQVVTILILLVTIWFHAHWSVALLLTWCLLLMGVLYLWVIQRVREELTVWKRVLESQERLLSLVKQSERPDGLSPLPTSSTPAEAE